MSIEKAALSSLIKKSRVHLYKPIQIAEILYKFYGDYFGMICGSTLKTLL